MNKMTALFLICLRLAIGWHFLFEGVNKLNSTYVGVTTTNKPFSSEVYFREAQGPLGPIIRDQIGDPDEIALEKLRLPMTIAQAKRKELPLQELVPEPVAKVWEDYYQKFLATFQIDDELKPEAAKRYDAGKLAVVEWLNQGKAEITHTSPAGAADVDVVMTTPERIAEYERKLESVRQVYADKLPKMGKDVEKTNLRALKAEVTSLRLKLMSDLDVHFDKFKGDLADLVNDQLADVTFKVPGKSEDEVLLTYLTPNGKAPPEVLVKQWDTYLKMVTKLDPSIDTTKALEAIENAKVRYVRFLNGQDEYTGSKVDLAGEPDRLQGYLQMTRELPGWAASVKASEELAAKADSDWKELVKNASQEEQNLAAIVQQKEAKKETAAGEKKRLTDLREANIKAIAEARAKASRLQVEAQLLKEKIRDQGILREWAKSEVNRHVATFKNQVAPNVDEELLKGFVDLPAEPKKIEYLDMLTRYGLTAIGVMLLLGLFTRLACTLGCGFLVMTYLAAPPLPWLPKSPMDEGNYLFVNKNVVEMFALAALATTRSGIWLGLDALIGYFFQGKNSK